MAKFGTISNVDFKYGQVDVSAIFRGATKIYEANRLQPSLLLHFDGSNGSTSFFDDSAYGHAITANGDAQISTLQSKFGGSSAYFDGTGDYLTVENNQTIQLTNSAAWTIEFWFYASSLSTQQHLLHRYDVSSPYTGYGIAFGSGGAANTTLRFWDGGSWRDIETSLSTDQWYHVAISFEGTASTARLFLDGVQKGSAFTPSSFISNTSVNLGIGGQYNGSLPFNGYIDELRIIKGEALYTSNFTPPSSPHPDPIFPTATGGVETYYIDGNTGLPYKAHTFNDVDPTSLLLNFDGSNGSTTFTDDSGWGRTVTANGNAQISTAQSKFGGSSLYLDGVADYLSVGHNILSDTSTSFDSDFTIEFWGYVNAIGTQQTFVGNRYDSGSNISGFTLRLNTDGKIRLFGFTGTGTGTSIDATTTSAITASEWHHFAVTHVAATNDWALFIDGALVLTDTGSVVSNASNNALQIGIENSSSWPLNGYIDSLRITKGQALYTAFSFDVPTSPATVYSQDASATSLLLHMDGDNGSVSFEDDSIHDHTVSVFGNATISTVKSKFGGSSAYFDGSGDYLSIPSTATLGFGSGDFTIDFWFYADNFTATTRPLANNVFVFNIDSNTTDNLGTIRFYDGVSNFSVADVVPSGQWSHIALVRRGTTASIFVNGQEVHSFTHTRSLGTPTTSYIVANPQFTTSSACYIDDLRVTKGVAIFPQPFTPSTTALTRVGSGSLNFTRGGVVDYLVVGGGGGGAVGAAGGGGGAGGYSFGSTSINNQQYSVHVGDGGGNGIPGVNSYGTNGANSNVFSIISDGGGGGGGLDGGSGGGGSLRNQAGGTATGTGIGNDGGSAVSGSSNVIGGGGGGGGASENGADGTTSVGGDGGDGLASSISGSSVTYAGGGGGGGRTDGTAPSAGSGGSGGGGDGSNTNTAANNGTANTGGGGGGGGFNAQPGGPGGSGGSGTVIVRYRVKEEEFSN